MHELGDKSSCMSDINVNKQVNNCPHLFGAEAAEVIEICMHQEWEATEKPVLPVIAPGQTPEEPISFLQPLLTK